MVGAEQHLGGGEVRTDGHPAPRHRYPNMIAFSLAGVVSPAIWPSDQGAHGLSACLSGFRTTATVQPALANGLRTPAASRAHPRSFNARRRRGTWSHSLAVLGSLLPCADPGRMLPLVALVLQWRQDYPNNRPPTWATAISAMGHCGHQRPLSEARETGVMFNHELPATICRCGIA
jgi:hypothetical protein